MPANLANERSMKTSFLDFEQSIADLESKIEELRFVQDDSAVDISAQCVVRDHRQDGAKDLFLHQLHFARDTKHQRGASWRSTASPHSVVSPSTAGAAASCIQHLRAKALGLAQHPA